jgi:acetyl-CoA carboxylase carboxyl transferase subunit beta
MSIITSPTTGGVTASFAMLGDVIFAEPKAVIGFAGRRVIEQTLQEQLPDDFQTSEYLLHHGLLDLIVPRYFLKQALSETMSIYKEAPLKVSGRIPYGGRGSLTKIREEQLRRFAQEPTNPNFTPLVKEFQELLNLLMGNASSLVFEGSSLFEPRDGVLEPQLVNQAFTAASERTTRLDWLNSTEFQVRPVF